MRSNNIDRHLRPRLSTIQTSKMPRRYQGIAGHWHQMVTTPNLPSEVLEKLAGLADFDFQHPESGPLLFSQIPSTKGCIFSVRPDRGILTGFQIHTRFPKASVSECMSMGVNPNTGDAFVSRDTTASDVRHTTATLSPFSVEIPSYGYSTTSSFAGLSQFKKPMLWDKFPGGGLSDRVKFWFLKTIAKKIPLGFRYSGEEPQMKWSINWWRQKEISLCADYQSGNISQIIFSALPEVDFPKVKLKVDTQRKWFDFQFDFLGYHWSVHFSFKQMMSEIFEFSERDGRGLVLFSEKATTLVLKRNHGSCIRLEFSESGENIRYIVRRADGSTGYGGQAPFREKAEFLTGLGPLASFLDGKGRSSIFRALVESN